MSLWPAGSATILGTLEEWLLPSTFLKAFSIVANHRCLFTNSSDERVNFIDALRITIILFGIAGHCFGCLETVPGWYTVTNLSIIKTRLKSIWVQPMLNEGGLGIGVTFVGGKFNSLIHSIELNCSRLN